MTRILEKRTYDVVTYDFLLTSLLASSELVTGVNTVLADQGALAFGTPTVNASPITYPNGVTAAAGKVIQVQISGGTIPIGSDSQDLGVPNLLCTVRVRFNTNLASNQLEATGLLLLKDQP